jgi:hypothetical protein
LGDSASRGENKTGAKKCAGSAVCEAECRKVWEEFNTGDVDDEVAMSETMAPRPRRGRNRAGNAVENQSNLKSVTIKTDEREREEKRDQSSSALTGGGGGAGGVSVCCE